MDIQSVEQALAMARKLGGLDAEFAALQDIIAALAIRHHAVGDGLDREFYDWYLRRLFKLDDEWVELKQTVGSPYQIRKDENIVIARIRAVLACLPEVEKQQPSTAVGNG